MNFYILRHCQAALQRGCRLTPSSSVMCLRTLRCPGSKFITIGSINKTCFLCWPTKTMIRSLNGHVRGAGTVVRKHWLHLNPLEGLLKHSWLGLIPRVSDPVGTGGHLRICFANKFRCGASAAGLETTLGLGWDLGRGLFQKVSKWF